MRSKTKIVLVMVLLVLAFLSAFVIVPGMRFSSVRQQYAVGMSFQDALQRVPQPFLVRTSGVVFADGPTEEQKRTYPHHSIVVDAQGAELQFDHYDRLIRVGSLSSPWHQWRWKVARE